MEQKKVSYIHEKVRSSIVDKNAVNQKLLKKDSTHYRVYIYTIELIKYV